MVVTAFVFSAVALMISLLAFLFARLEYRQSGPVKTVFGISGLLSPISDEISVQADQDSAFMGIIVSNQLNDPAGEVKKYTVAGVAVRNSGRSAISVRSVHIREEVEFEPGELPPGWPRTGASIGTPTQWAAGPELPFLLEGGTTEYWLISMIEIVGRSPCSISFQVLFGDGSIMQTEPHRITRE